MSAQAEALVRAYGADAREHISKLFVTLGPDLAEQVAGRFVWEVADFVGEASGAAAALAMLYRAVDGVSLQQVPPVTITGEDEPDPLVLALDGLATVSDQARQNLATLAVATGVMIETLTERLAAPPRTWGERAWVALERVQWWPLAFAAGAVFAAVIR